MTKAEAIKIIVECAELYIVVDCKIVQHFSCSFAIILFALQHRN